MASEVYTSINTEKYSNVIADVDKVTKKRFNRKAKDEHFEMETEGLVQDPIGYSSLKSSKSDKSDHICHIRSVDGHIDGLCDRANVEKDSNLDFDALPESTPSNTIHNKMNSNQLNRSLYTDPHKPSLLEQSAPGFAKSEDPPQQLQSDQRSISVNIITTERIGDFILDKATTFKDLRRKIEQATGDNLFSFQDSKSLQKLTNEDISIPDLNNSQVFLSRLDLRSVLTDAIIKPTADSAIRSDGTAIFKVLWWDELFNKPRPVQLRFEAHQIMVSGPAASFYLFHFQNFRYNLKISSVKGRPSHFQFVRSEDGKASRFYASNPDQATLITLYFCFDWKANATMRGWFKREQDDLSDAVSSRDLNGLQKIVHHYHTAIGTILQDCETQDEFKALVLPFFKQIFTAYIPNLSGQDVTDYKPLLEQLQSTSLDHGTSKDSSHNTRIPLTQATQNSTSSLPRKQHHLSLMDRIRSIDFIEIDAGNEYGSIWDEIRTSNRPNALGHQGSNLLEELEAVFGPITQLQLSPNYPTETLLIDRVLDHHKIEPLETLIKGNHILNSASVDEIIQMFLDFDPEIFQSAKLLILMSANPISRKLSPFDFPSHDIEQLREYEMRAAKPSKLCKAEELLLRIHQLVPDLQDRIKFALKMVDIGNLIQSVQNSIWAVETAIDSIRKSAKFKLALEIAFTIASTLTTGDLNHKGFKISTFFDRVKCIEGEFAGRIVLDRCDQGDLDSEYVRFRVKLNEYIVVKMQDNPECKGWWNDLIPICSFAKSFDLELDLNTAKEIDIDFMEMEHYLQEKQECKHSDSDSRKVDPMLEQLQLFLGKRDSLKSCIRRISSTIEETVKLWDWLGEPRTGIHKQIFEHLYNFALNFEMTNLIIEETWNMKYRHIISGRTSLQLFSKPSKTNSSKKNVQKEIPTSKQEEDSNRYSDDFLDTNVSSGNRNYRVQQLVHE